MFLAHQVHIYRQKPDFAAISQEPILKLKAVFAALMMIAAIPSMAATIPLGSLSVPGAAALGNVFTSPGDFQDDYTFSISAPADAGGLTLEFDFSNSLGIDLSGVRLAGSGGYVGSDASPSLYSFYSLGEGSYTLSILGTVTGSLNTRTANTGSVSYWGLLFLGSARTPTSVPEPGTLALFGAALVGVAMATRRRAARN